MMAQQPRLKGRVALNGSNILTTCLKLSLLVMFTFCRITKDHTGAGRVLALVIAWLVVALPNVNQDNNPGMLELGTLCLQESCKRGCDVIM